jgi:hypothetical protein
MALNITTINNGDSGLSVRTKLNLLIQAAMTGGLPGTISPDDLEAAFDKTAPAKITGLALTSTLVPTPTLIISWDFSPALDFAYYDLQIAEGEDGPWISYTTTVERYALPAKFALYRARIRAFDKSGNDSGFNVTDDGEDVSITIAGDTIPPAAPIDLVATGGLGNVWLKWTPNTEDDFAFYELYESASGTTPDDDVAASFTAPGTTYVRSGIDGKQTLYYWVRAVDTSGNRSPWSARADAETEATVQSDIVATVGIFFTPAQEEGNRVEWTAGSISYGPPGETPTTKAIDAGYADWSTGTLYVYYVRGNTALSVTTSLVTVYTSNGLIMGVYRGGSDFQLLQGKAKIDGADLLAQTVGANALVTNEAVITGSAQIADAIVTSAKIVNLDAVKIIAASVESNNALIGLINDANVQIDPGLIKVSGSTTLADWRFGGDNTLIDGGNVAAGTLLANSAVFGMRGLAIDGLQFEFNDPSTNYVSWSAGAISYIGDDGNVANQSVSAGNAHWSAGTLYLIYVKGDAALSVTTDRAVAFASDAAVLATYNGDTDLTANFGRTTIDGGTIRGIMAAFQSADIDSLRTSILTADSILASMISVANLAAITSNLGAVTAGSININDRFIVDSDGNVTIQGDPEEPHLVLTNDYLDIFS